MDTSLRSVWQFYKYDKDFIILSDSEMTNLQVWQAALLKKPLKILKMLGNFDFWILKAFEI